LSKLSKVPSFYEQVICSYNKAKIRKEPSNYEDFQNEILWGNKYLKIDKDKIIYFKNWIESNILRVRDLVFKNGSIDVAALLNKLSAKQNFIAEVWQINSVCKRYTHLLNYNDALCETNQLDNDCIYKAKHYYNLLVQLKFEKPTLQKWKGILNANGTSINEYDINKSFIGKVKCIHDRNIAAFNYKILSRSLICGYVLSKWNTDVSDRCLVCNEKDTIEHMLYQCKISQYLWKKIEIVIGRKITLKDVVMGMECVYLEKMHTNHVISVFCYLLYKFWLLSIQNKVTRSINQMILYIKNEIRLKMEIYQRTKYSYVSIGLSKILYVL
jgi:hypothetical protein